MKTNKEKYIDLWRQQLKLKKKALRCLEKLSSEDICEVYTSCNKLSYESVEYEAMLKRLPKTQIQKEIEAYHALKLS